MRVIRQPGVMQRLARRWQREGVRIGFVPTMGYLHEGHLSLVQVARRAVGRSGRVVVSIYVNPTQFGPGEDLDRYPRDLPRDLRLCREAGVDVVFAPDDQSMYPGLPEGRYSTYVVEEQLSRSMEGAARPGHFRGVTTVVAKLFHLVLPDVAVFGAKDWQQAAVIRRMVDNLNFPVRILVAPTVREPDGLAMSSRNAYLNPDERRQATVLFEAIQLARQKVRSGPKPARQLKQDVARLVASRPRARLDYVEFFDSDTLEPVPQVRPGTHMALAVFVGNTRLIDNAKL
ncbi:pantoate--beta-alanine ligase [Limisphaera sp. VF-2]|jgi:pantoate--beta-alanine ligase|uniref:pantoate--beta-alanine ligase n=1 Tax=Limisphaera sp. VF-2 TaxID=3400418 RepID=UPI0017754A5A|nr:pantoate--beta-alanine ligase [Limisphaera sp.]